MMASEFVELGGEDDIVEAEAVVVVNDALGVGTSAGVAAGEHFTNLIVVVVLWEILKSAHMVGVIAKDAVEGGVAVLQPTHVDGDDCDARLECLLVFDKESLRVGDATDEHIGTVRHFVDVIDDFERHILIVLETLDKTFGLVFITHEEHGKVAIGLLFEDAEQGGTGGVAQSHHTICGGVALAECHRRNGGNGASAHGGDPVCVDEGEELT